MPLRHRLLFLPILMASLFGCSDEQALIPTDQLTAEQKAAVKAEDDKVADEESHGAKRR